MQCNTADALAGRAYGQGRTALHCVLDLQNSVVAGTDAKLHQQKVCTPSEISAVSICVGSIVSVRGIHMTHWNLM